MHSPAAAAHHGKRLLARNPLNGDHNPLLLLRKITSPAPNRGATNMASYTASLDGPDGSTLPSVAQCLDKYLEGESLTGDNRYMCGRCEGKRDAVRELALRKLPPLLTVQLVRFEYDPEAMARRKVRARVHLDPVLMVPERPVPSAAASALSNDSSEQRAEYHLHAVLHHKGTGATSGHYVAEVLDPVTGRCNDVEYVPPKDKPKGGRKPAAKPRGGKAKAPAGGSKGTSGASENATSNATSEAMAAAEGEEGDKVVRGAVQKRLGEEDAYMLVYCRKGYLDEEGTETPLPDAIKEHVTASSIASAAAAETYAQQRSALETRMQERRNTYQAHFGHIPAAAATPAAAAAAAAPAAAAPLAKRTLAEFAQQEPYAPAAPPLPLLPAADALRAAPSDAEVCGGAFALVDAHWLRQWVVGHALPTPVEVAVAAAARRRRAQLRRSGGIGGAAAVAAADAVEVISDGETPVQDKQGGDASPDPRVSPVVNVDSDDDEKPEAGSDEGDDGGTADASPDASDWTQRTNPTAPAANGSTAAGSKGLFCDPLPNARHRCPHGRVRPAAIRDLKLVTQELYFALENGCGEDGLAITGQNYRCEDCIVDHLKSEGSAKEALKAGQPSLDSWLAGSSSSSGGGSSGGAADSSSAAPLDPAINTAARCEHGSLAPRSRKLWRAISAEGWAILRDVFPGALELPLRDGVCQQCSEKEHTAAEVRAAVKGRKEQELDTHFLKDLLKRKRTHPKEWLVDENGALTTVYLVAGGWLQRWRRWHLDKHDTFSEPGPVDNSSLFCAHNLLIITPDTMDMCMRVCQDRQNIPLSADAAPQVEIVTAAEWQGLCAQYGEGEGGAVRIVGGKTILPLSCEACLEGRQAREEADKCTFKGRTITVVLLRSGQLPPEPESAAADGRPQRRTRKSREVQILCNSDDAVQQLQVRIKCNIEVCNRPLEAQRRTRKSREVQIECNSNDAVQQLQVSIYLELEVSLSAQVLTHFNTVRRANVRIAADQRELPLSALDIRAGDTIYCGVDTAADCTDDPQLSFLLVCDAAVRSSSGVQRRPRMLPAHELQPHAPVTRDELLWARGVHGPVDAALVAEDEGPWTCYTCAGSLRHTRSHIRNVNGLVVPLRAFFSHFRRANCEGGESALHLASNAVRGVQYYDVCNDCKTEFDIVIPGTPYKGERAVQLEGRTYRPDVSYIDASGALVGCVEICALHAISNEKAMAYTAAGLAWCEVEVRLHLEAYLATAAAAGGDSSSQSSSAQPQRLRVLRSALGGGTFASCPSCSAERERKEEAAAAAKAAANAVKCAAHLQRMHTMAPALGISNIVNEFTAFYTQKMGHRPSVVISLAVGDPAGVVPFGRQVIRFKGQHLDAIIEDNPSFVQWLRDDCRAALYALRKRAKEMLQHRCRRCYGELEEDWHSLCSSCRVEEQCEGESDGGGTCECCDEEVEKDWQTLCKRCWRLQQGWN
ncbi:hypothetical protein JKP88DRAFT_265941 [Tribonema minus]|uniref:ubiquitinyl hydrolase 1 n=1 Tax=Tribonema minus TaxID=303371 RepID=A0A835YHB9_9STRA|nr:hypothetical protein JKP88DRAFT_265941 [Tribonema minus]